MQKLIRLFTWTMMGMMTVMMAGMVTASEKATKAECKAKVEEAVDLVKNIGLDETLKIIQEDKTAFVWKDTYVFAVKLSNATCLAHPVSPRQVGRVMAAAKDVKGKMFFVEFINVARKQGSGWVGYMWPKPGEKKPSTKETFIMRVPGENALFGAGVYTD
jgi:signal transduction histidine kinase